MVTLFGWLCISNKSSGFVILPWELRSLIEMGLGDLLGLSGC